mgnify:CR=1 FL=1
MLSVSVYVFAKANSESLSVGGFGGYERKFSNVSFSHAFEKIFQNFEKSWKKVLTKAWECDIIVKLSPEKRETANGHWKLNNKREVQSISKCEIQISSNEFIYTQTK